MIYLFRLVEEEVQRRQRRQKPEIRKVLLNIKCECINIASGASEIRKETRSERENGKATATIIISGPHPEENPLCAGEFEGEQSEGTTTSTTNVRNEGWIDDEGETKKKKNRT